MEFNFIPLTVYAAGLTAKNLNANEQFFFRFSGAVMIVAVVVYVIPLCFIV